MADTPVRATITAQTPNGTVTFTIDDEEALQNIDNAVAMWNAPSVGDRLGLDVQSVEVER